VPPDAQPRVRLQRVLNDAGIAARRTCEQMILDGRVRVNGQAVRTLPAFVDPASDRIEVDGRPLRDPGAHVYIMLHKPARTLATVADEPGMDRRTVLDLVDHPAAARLFPVGRLDYDTTGLVLLTNDGDLANRLTHPRFGIAKRYLVSVKGVANDATLSSIARQIKLIAKHERVIARSEQKRLAPGPAPAQKRPKLQRPDLRIVEVAEGKTELLVTTTESAVTPLIDALLAAGLPVKKVVRTGLGPLELKNLPLGAWRELTPAEVHRLRKAKPYAREATVPRPPAAAPPARPACASAGSVARAPKSPKFPQPAPTRAAREQRDPRDKSARRARPAPAPSRPDAPAPTTAHPQRKPWRPRTIRPTDAP
jgi:pseudouridine synthase